MKSLTTAALAFSLASFFTISALANPAPKGWDGPFGTNWTAPSNFTRPPTPTWSGAPTSTFSPSAECTAAVQSFNATVLAPCAPTATPTPTTSAGRTKDYDDSALAASGKCVCEVPDLLADVQDVVNACASSVPAAGDVYWWGGRGPFGAGGVNATLNEIKSVCAALNVTVTGTLTAPTGTSTSSSSTGSAGAAGVAIVSQAFSARPGFLASGGGAALLAFVIAAVAFL
ncbi:hypothetical protein DFJ73DRAFT_900948 [Zopfochytrium polystomum]|nr:hypothetical protein DFJ73DRAFT_900948 [Zopfochytrium polystomum]